MALSPRLELRQGQSLVLTPQLQQAIKLLQLSNLELTSYVESELERNPLLEKVDENTPQLLYCSPGSIWYVVGLFIVVLCYFPLNIIIFTSNYNVLLNIP